MYKLMDIHTPSRFIVMGDSDAFSWQNASTPWWTQWHGVTKENEGTPGHPGWPIANVLFADWHVETVAIGNKPSPHNFGNNYHFDVDNER
jgi:prepilin-type processing-associated H-X9-DG protein